MARVIQIAVELGFNPRLFNSRTDVLNYYVTLPVLYLLSYAAVKPPNLAVFQ